MTRAFIALSILLTLSTSAYALRAAEEPERSKPRVWACTKDARICPDGTSVGRVPPSCNFAPCAGEPGVVEGNPGPGGTDGSNPDDVVSSPPSPGPGEPMPIPEPKPMPEPMPYPGGPVPAPSPMPEPGGRMCTMDAKICPDGTGVGRTGPNCEFAPCPGEPGSTPPSPPTENPEELPEE